jgi:hypothetical protein
MGALTLLVLVCFAGTIMQGIVMIWRGYSALRLAGLIIGIATTASLVVLWLAWVRVVIS